MFDATCSSKKFVSFKVSAITFGLPWLLRLLKVLLLGEDAMQIFVTAVAGHGASGLLLGLFP